MDPEDSEIKFILENADVFDVELTDHVSLEDLLNGRVIAEAPADGETIDVNGRSTPQETYYVGSHNTLFAAADTHQMDGPLPDDNDTHSKVDEALICNDGADAIKSVIHTLFIKSFPFEKIIQNEKTVEVRLATEANLKINIGDKLRFLCGKRTETRLVIGKNSYHSFQELLESEGLQKCLPGVTDMEEAVQYYRDFPKYHKMEIVHGVVAFRLAPQVDDSSHNKNEAPSSAVKQVEPNGSHGVIKKTKKQVDIPTLNATSGAKSDLREDAEDFHTIDDAMPTAHEKRTIQWISIDTTYEMSDPLFQEVYDDTTKTVNHGQFLYRKDSIAIEVDKLFEGCVIYVDKYNRAKKYWKLRAYCMHNGCRKYVLTASHMNPKLFTIEVDKLETNHIKPLARQLRRYERDQSVEILKNVRPKDLRDKKVNSADEKVTLAGNYQEAMSSCVFEKARSVALKKQDKCPDDDIDDVEKMKTDDPNTNFISNTLPKKSFAVYIHSKRQHDVLHKLHIMRSVYGIQIVARLDASSEIARDIDSQKLLYHAITLNLRIRHDKTTTPMPFSEQFNVKNTSIDMARWLFDFVLSHAYFYEDHPLLFDWIVIDFSYASFHAILKAFNAISLKAYLNLCKKWISQKIMNGMFPGDFYLMVKLRMCYTHLMHTFALMTKRLYGKEENKQKPHSRIILEILATMIKANEYSLLLKCFQQLSILLKSEYVNDDTENAFVEINNIKTVAVNLEDYEEEKLERGVDVDILPEYEGALYKSNLFYLEFAEISDKVKSYYYTGKPKEKNVFYNPEFLQKFLVRFVPLIPLWTSILDYQSKSTSDQQPPLSVLEDFHNQPMENFFGWYKQQLDYNSNTLGRLPIKIGRAITFSQNMMTPTIKSVNCLIPKERMNTQKPRKPYVRRNAQHSSACSNQDIVRDADPLQQKEQDQIQGEPVENVVINQVFGEKGKDASGEEIFIEIDTEGKPAQDNAIRTLQLVQNHSQDIVRDADPLHQKKQDQTQGEPVEDVVINQILEEKGKDASGEEIFIEIDTEGKPAQDNAIRTLQLVQNHSQDAIKGNPVQTTSKCQRNTVKTSTRKKVSNDENATSFAESKEGFNKKRPVKNFSYLQGRQLQKASNKRVLETSKVQNAIEPKFCRNGLWENTAFYTNLKVEFILAKKNGISLTNKHFDALNPKQHVSEAVMQYLLSSLPKSAKAKAHVSQEGVVKFEKVDKSFKAEFVTIWTLTGWAMIIINHKTKSFGFVNEYLISKKIVETFSSPLGCEKYTLFNIENTPSYQHDNGIYVHKMILIYIATGRTLLDKEFSADIYRSELQMMIIRGSDNMKNSCTICGSDNEDNVMGECTYCKRWLHCSCMNVTELEVSADDQFKCTLCRLIKF